MNLTEPDGTRPSARAMNMGNPCFTVSSNLIASRFLVCLGLRGVAMTVGQYLFVSIGRLVRFHSIRISKAYEQQPLHLVQSPAILLVSTVHPLPFIAASGAS